MKLLKDDEGRLNIMQFPNHCQISGTNIGLAGHGSRAV
jgi:hypothetical protein